jgi:hypothetical protein
VLRDLHRQHRDQCWPTKMLLKTSRSVTLRAKPRFTSTNTLVQHNSYGEWLRPLVKEPSAPDAVMQHALTCGSVALLST